MTTTYLDNNNLNDLYPIIPVLEDQIKFIT